MENEFVSLHIDQIKMYDNNPRINDESVDHVKNSIKEFGFLAPVVVNEDFVLLAGHTRVKAAKALGIQNVPAIVAHNLDEARQKAYRIADNSAGQNSRWDFKLLDFEIDQIKKDLPQMNLLDFGLDYKKINKGKTDDDEVPATPKEPITQAGDVYQLGKHKVVCGSSLNFGEYEKIFPQGHTMADLIFTDPPYNVAYTGKTKDALKIQNDEMTDGDFSHFLFEAFKAMSSFIKRGGAAYICHADSEGVNFRETFVAAGFLLKQCIIWNKDSFVMGRQDYHWKHEPILYGWLAGESHKFYGERNQSTVWDVPRPKRSEQHPTMKPIALIEKAIENSTKIDDLILDPFLGSGSTLIAAEKNNRICYGIELDPKYVDVIVTRYCQYVGNWQIVRNGEKMLWEGGSNESKSESGQDSIKV